MTDDADKIKKMMKELRKEDHIKTDSLLKETFSNYIRLIGDADRKARIILIVNSILLTIGVTVISKGLGDSYYAWISAVLLIASNLLSLFFSILSVRPEMKKNLGSRTEDNILHYSNTTGYSLEQYSAIVRATLHDNEKKIDSVIKDLYFYGNLLSRKYRLMKIAYVFFYWGIAVSVVSYLFLYYFIK
jgi:hypothetical protein